MKDNNAADTRPLLSLLMLLIYTAVALCIVAFGYIMLEDPIQDYLNRPKYTKESLAALSAKRAKLIQRTRAENWDLIENGVHVKTGLKDDEHLKLVISSCTSCHSAKLITQNRATKQGWKDMIKWMQQTQGLTDLGTNEPKIISYLSKHYAPEKIGRRQNLNTEEIEWYILNLEGE